MIVKSKWLIVFVVLALALAGCGSGDNTNSQNTIATGVPEGLSDPGAATQPAATTIPQAGVEQTNVPLSPTEAAAMSVLGSRLIEAEVLDENGQPLGVSRGMVFEPTGAQVRYLVVEPDSKEGERQVLAPWQSLLLDLPGREEGVTVRMAVDAETLAMAPDFTGAEFEGEAALDWDAGVESYWASVLPELPVTGDQEKEDESAADPDEEQPVTGLTSMPVLVGSVENGQELNFEVRDTEGNVLGIVRDVVVSGNGQVTFGLLEPDASNGTVFGEGTGQVVISWKAMGWDPEENALVLSAPPEALAGAPRVEEGAMPDMSLPGWEADWADYWENTELRGPEATAAAITPLPEVTATGDAGTGSQDSGTNEQDTAGSVQPTRIPVRAGLLNGHEVTSNSGEVLGTVSDIILSPSGVVEYLVLSTQPGPGQGANQGQGRAGQGNSGQGNSGQGNRARGVNQGGRLAPVPWTALNWDPQEDKLVFTEQVTVFNNAPAFDGPETFGLEEDWWSEAAEYWQTFVIIPTAEAAPVENARLRQSDVVGKEARGAQDESIGTAEDLMMDENGVVRYLVVRDSLDNAFHAVPWEYFYYNPEDGSLLYTDDVENLHASPPVQTVEDYDRMDAGQMDELLAHWGQG